MTRTTELLKGCRRVVSKPNNKYLIWTCGKKDLCENCKSELRGRLDALKEEETYLIQFEKDFQNITPILIGEEIEYRLASIQEEIKLIEGTI